MSAEGQDLSNEVMVTVKAVDRTEQYLKARETMGVVEAMESLGEPAPEICPGCEGAGYSSETCLRCNGSGEGPADGTRCRACNGTGTEVVPCEDCNGVGTEVL